ncbi:MAG: type IX secretion system sortase PorU [Candidatus Cloacimonadaceae bacterium]|nr:type IX secretion system sortase PorU [Candidatus Cloacimonadota bacterium]
MKRIILALSMLFSIIWMQASITVVDQSSDEITLDFILDDYDIAEGPDFSSLRYREGAYPEIPGSPSIPTLEFKIGVPSDGSASATIISSTKTRISLNKRIKPVPTPISSEGISDYLYEINESLYTTYEQSALYSVGLHSFRDHPYMVFIINPFIYDGNLGLEVIKTARINVQIAGNTDQKGILRSDHMSDVFFNQVLNKDNAKYWLKTYRTDVQYADFSQSPWWAKIEVDKTGMFRINRSQLSDFLLEDIDPRSFRLFGTTGQYQDQTEIMPGDRFSEIPIQVVGADDGSFDASDYIVFYGEDRTGYVKNSILQTSDQSIYHNPYSHNGIYWLSFAGNFPSPPLRIQQDDVVFAYNDSTDYHTANVHIEQESYRPSITGYTWYMARMNGNTTMDYSFDIDLPDLDPSIDQQLIMRMRQDSGTGAVTNQISVYVNGNLVPSSETNTNVHTWYGSTIFKFSRSTQYFVAGSNTITIRVIRNSSNNINLDYYSVSYARKLIKKNEQYTVNAVENNFMLPVKYIFNGYASDITVYKVMPGNNISNINIMPESDSFHFITRSNADTKFYVSRPAELYSPASITVLEPKDLTAPKDPVESVIVVPEEFAGKAEELAEMYRQNWGMATRVVLQSDIMNQFNGGYPDPMAIRQFLRYLYHNLPEPKIRSLTLLGMGTMDWRNYSRVAAGKNKVMIFQHPTNYITSDDYFGMLTNLNHPEIAIGRYPVSTLSDLNIMMENFRRYTQEPKPGLWRNSLLFLADDNVNGTNTMDWQHTRDMQSLSTFINPQVLNTKIFAAEYDTDEFLNKPRVRDEMFEEINEGKLIWYYIGHGSFDTLGMQNYFTGSTDIGKFRNPDMLPLFIAASCEISAFDHWSYESLGQKTILVNNGGAIASVAATRKSFPDPNNDLMELFIPNMTNSRMPLGTALTAAKTTYTQSVNNDAMYIILGDPNLYTVPPQSIPSIRPISGGKDKNLFHSRQHASFSGHMNEKGISGEALFKAYNSDSEYTFAGIDISKKGNPIFNGSVTVKESSFHGGFWVPDDVLSGNSGLVLSYLWDNASNTDYISYYHPLNLSDEVLPDSMPNEAPPAIDIFLGSYDFRAGDTVNTSPVLYAKIADSNGINVTGSAGHNILLVIDNSLQPLVVTGYFTYDVDSAVSGTLTFPMPTLDEGPHTIQLIAFDNFNLPSVATTHFIAKDSGPISLQNLLIYPNPMKKDAHITFIISESAEVTVEIFTMSGRRIRRIETTAQQGFNKIPFDGRDQFNDKLANNTYFFRVKAKTQDGKSTEARDRFVVYK